MVAALSFWALLPPACVDRPVGSVSLKGGAMQRLGSAVLTCEGVTVEVRAAATPVPP